MALTAFGVKLPGDRLRCSPSLRNGFALIDAQAHGHSPNKGLDRMGMF